MVAHRGRVHDLENVEVRDLGELLEPSLGTLLGAQVLGVGPDCSHTWPRSASSVVVLVRAFGAALEIHRRWLAAAGCLRLAR
eukprot:5678850-Alexandrium_andersonii.AAC.1